MSKKSLTGCKLAGVRAVLQLNHGIDWVSSRFWKDAMKTTSDPLSYAIWFVRQRWHIAGCLLVLEGGA